MNTKAQSLLERHLPWFIGVMVIAVVFYFITNHRLDAVENELKTVTQIQIDVAVQKSEIIHIKKDIRDIKEILKDINRKLN